MTIREEREFASFVLSLRRKIRPRFPKSPKLSLKVYLYRTEERRSRAQIRGSGKEISRERGLKRAVFPTASDTRLSYIIITIVSSWKQWVR